MQSQHVARSLQYSRDACPAHMQAHPTPSVLAFTMFESLTLRCWRRFAGSGAVGPGKLQVIAQVSIARVHVYEHWSIASAYYKFCRPENVL